jgi:hypothetical protein
MGGTCGTYGDEERCYDFGNLSEREYLEEIGIEGKY